MTYSQNRTTDTVSNIQAIFVIVTIIFMTIFYSVGCLDKGNPLTANSPTLSTTATAEDNTGIAKLIRSHFGTALGQIIAVENYYQNAAQAIVTLTIPQPDVAKVYIIRENNAWVIERVEKGYTLEQ
ncbi:MAG: hypothetical protein QMC67_02120 [Candidatus Wallbacteria bacterium]